MSSMKGVCAGSEAAKKLLIGRATMTASRSKRTADLPPPLLPVFSMRRSIPVARDLRRRIDCVLGELGRRHLSEVDLAVTPSDTTVVEITHELVGRIPNAGRTRYDIVRCPDQCTRQEPAVF
jgi:hypothetical protein